MKLSAAFVTLGIASAFFQPANAATAIEELGIPVRGLSTAAGIIRPATI